MYEIFYSRTICLFFKYCFFKSFYIINICSASISPGTSTCWILISLLIEQIKVEMRNTLSILRLLLSLYQAVCRALSVHGIMCNHIKIRLNRTSNNHTLIYDPHHGLFIEDNWCGQVTIEKRLKVSSREAITNLLQPAVEMLQFGNWVIGQFINKTERMLSLTTSVGL